MPAAAAVATGLDGHARVMGRLSGPAGQSAVAMFRIQGLVCCTALAVARPCAPVSFATALGSLSEWANSVRPDAEPARTPDEFPHASAFIF